MASWLTAEACVERAHAATGLDDLGAPSWREGLEQLLASARADAGLDDGGRDVLLGYVHERLVNRLRVVDWRSRHADEVSLQRVERPWFVGGMPRTGTTLLHQLLHRDPRARSVMKWEALDSVPPPEAGHLDDDPRVAPTVAATEAMYDAVPELKAQHYEPGDGPTECGMLLGQDFRCIDAEGFAHVRGYGRWLDRADLRPAYGYHASVLEMLQSRAPGRWTLKAPEHLLGLDAIRAVHPDAKLIVTHRDPLDSVASTAHLVRSATALLGEDRPEEVGRRWFALLATMTDRLTEFRDRHGGDEVVDVHYDELVADPLATVAAVYERLGVALEHDAEVAMGDYVRDNPRGKHGSYDYSLADVGLTEAEVRERFAPYCERFGVTTNDRT